MQTGKLTKSALSKMFKEKTRERTPQINEAFMCSSIDEDCALLDIDAKRLVVSTAQVTEAQKDAGRLIINICTDNITAAGGIPEGISVTALFPPKSAEYEVTDFLEALFTEAKSQNIAVIGIHTEITEAVNKMVVTGTAHGKLEGGGQMNAPEEKSRRLIVFVCTGNTCRSPMAEGFAKSLSDEFEFVSRGMSVYGGTISENARLVIEENGITMPDFTPSAFTRRDAVRARLILTMAESHKHMILETYGDIEGIGDKTFTLREYAYGEAGDIKDPFGQGADYYRKCGGEIKACVENVLKNFSSSTL